MLNGAQRSEASLRTKRFGHPGIRKQPFWCPPADEYWSKRISQTGFLNKNLPERVYGSAIRWFPPMLWGYTPSELPISLLNFDEYQPICANCTNQAGDILGKLPVDTGTRRKYTCLNDLEKYINMMLSVASIIVIVLISILVLILGIESPTYAWTVTTIRRR
jgi:hypothetical protein